MCTCYLENEHALQKKYKRPVSESPRKEKQMDSNCVESQVIWLAGFITI